MCLNDGNTAALYTAVVLSKESRKSTTLYVVRTPGNVYLVHASVSTSTRTEYQVDINVRTYQGYILRTYVYTTRYVLIYSWSF